MQRRRFSPLQPLGLLEFATALAIAVGMPAASAAQGSERFQLVRSTSGTRGTPDGKGFVMEDPRSEFQAGKDRQVLVLFEWRGPVGHHRCEGAWKDPSGRSVYTSQAEVDARSARFAVYWGLSLPDTVAAGNWVVEAKVDGEPAGAHPFRIVADPSVVTTPPRRALKMAELYQVGLAHTLTLEAVDAKGSLLGRASGFFLSPTLVLSSLSGINAAHAVRLVRPGGAPVETSDVVSWNRRDDWVVLRFAGASGQPPKQAAAQPQVGDRCFFLDAQGDAGRVIMDTAVVGRGEGGDLVVGETAAEDSLGGPLLDEFGDVVAVVTGSRILGVTGEDGFAYMGVRGEAPRGTRARPLPAPPSEDGAVRTLDDLLKAGVFVRPVVRTPHVLIGGVGTGVDRNGSIPNLRDQRYRFTRADGHCVAFMTWDPREKEDAVLAFELRDEDNRVVAASAQRRVKMRTGGIFFQWWDIACASLKPGLYRVDAVRTGEPVWRTFFRLAD
jgi:hypothetical protein